MHLISTLRTQTAAALLLVSSLFAVPLQAQSDDSTLINITTLEQLDCIRLDLDGDGVPSGDTTEQQAYRKAFELAEGVNHNCTGDCMGYELMNNLDFEDADSYAAVTQNNAWVDPASGGTPGTSGWAPIGSSYPYFTAIFDGNGHTISNLYINSSASRVGLFGSTGTDSEIRNLGLEHGSVTGGAGNYVYTGGLVGFNGSDSTISASYATGSVTGGTSTGGLVGFNYTDGRIIASYATGSVMGDEVTGGLVGSNQGTISASYATGSVTGGTSTGGLVGFNGSDSTISASYATGSVTGGDNTGGLVGRNGGSIIASYATASVTGRSYASTGGLVGHNSGTVGNSYFDSTVNAALNATGNSPGTVTNVSGKTTAELQAPTTYSTAIDAMYYEWNRNIDGDLDTAAADIVWDFGTERRYPKLRVEWDATSGATAAEFGTPQRFILTDASDVERHGFSVTENSAPVSLGFIKGTKAGSSPSFSLTSSHFNVHATNGAISVVSGTMFDFEVAVEHLLNIEVGEGGETFTRNVAVWITNVLEDTDLTDGNLILIRTLEQLDAIRYDLDGDGVPAGNLTEQQAYHDAFGLAAGANHHCAGGCRGYRLVHDLDFEDAGSYAAATRNNAWVDPANNGTPGTSGWVPIGSSTLVSYAFAAIFDGNGHTISNLYINSYASDFVGFFGRTGTGSEIRNLGLEHGSVTATGRSYYVVSTGGMVGSNSGTIIASYATASVTGGTGNSAYTGGLVGFNYTDGRIIASYATASVTGGTGTNDSTGGLVGFNNGRIIASYATASVTGLATGTSAYTGGLVGRNGGSIIASYATGSVTGGGRTGGLVGYNNNGTISASYATASVTGGGNAGGLVGRNYYGTISASYATGTATAPTSTAGGLVGWNGGAISASYATGAVTAHVPAGGLVGNNYGGSISASYSMGDATAITYAGGLVGLNIAGTISASYAMGDATATISTAGGLVGSNIAGTITNSYFDSALSSATQGVGDDTSIVGLGKTTAELQSPYAYTGIYAAWNIDVDDGLPIGVDDGSTAGDPTADNPWDFGTEKRYPKLKVDFDGMDGAMAAEFGTPQRFILTDASDVEVPRFSVVESASIATIVGSIKDVSGTSPSFLLTSTAFSVGTTDGAISVASALDFETISTYVLDIGVSNGSSHFTRTVIVRVTQAAAVSATTSSGGGADPLREDDLLSSLPRSEDPLRVYPNPASREVRFAGLSSTHRYVYKIYSLAGQEILSGTLRRSSLDVSALANGQYLLVLKNEDGNELLRAQVLVLK